MTVPTVWFYSCIGMATITEFFFIAMTLHARLLQALAVVLTFDRNNSTIAVVFSGIATIT